MEEWLVNRIHGTDHKLLLLLLIDLKWKMMRSVDIFTNHRNEIGGYKKE